jgi:hypothetical protein
MLGVLLLSKTCTYWYAVQSQFDGTSMYICTAHKSIHTYIHVLTEPRSRRFLEMQRRMPFVWPLFKRAIKIYDNDLASPLVEFPGNYVHLLVPLRSTRSTPYPLSKIFDTAIKDICMNT